MPVFGQNLQIFEHVYQNVRKHKLFIDIDFKRAKNTEFGQKMGFSHGYDVIGGPKIAKNFQKYYFNQFLV